MEEGKDSREITVADIYTISPFGNRILTYAITGKQMAQQLERALVGLNPSVGIDSDQGYQASNLGDRFAGIRATYKVVDGGIQVLSIMTEDGKSIDVNDTTKTYNVCVNEYCATLPDSAFKDLKPHTLTLESRLAQLKEEVAKFDESKLTKEDQEALTMLKEELNIQHIACSRKSDSRRKERLRSVKNTSGNVTCEASGRTTEDGTKTRTNNDVDDFNSSRSSR